MKQDLGEALPKVRNPPSFTLRKEKKQRRLHETGPSSLKYYIRCQINQPQLTFYTLILFWNQKKKKKIIFICSFISYIQHLELQ